MRARDVAFYTVCAIPVICLLMGVMGFVPWKYANGVTVVALLLGVRLGLRARKKTDDDTGRDDETLQASQRR